MLSEEKSSLEAELSECRQQLELVQCDSGVNKELRMLRGLVRSLQEQLTASQAKHQRLMMKRSQQCRLLIDEVHDVHKMLTPCPLIIFNATSCATEKVP